MRYTTKYFDRETGLYYYGKRHYSPVWRRWLTRDPIGEDGGVNLYGFCGNRATLCHDNIGLISVTVTSRRENSFFQRLLGRGLYSYVNVGGVSDVGIEDMSSDRYRGLFSAVLSIRKCEVNLFVLIYLENRLVLEGKPGTVYGFETHTKNGGGGISTSSDGSPQVRGGILAHEQGHALSYLTTFLRKFRQEVERFDAGKLTENDRREIERIYKRCLNECKSDDAEKANAAHVGWYKEHGYIIEVK